MSRNRVRGKANALVQKFYQIRSGVRAEANRGNKGRGTGSAQNTSQAKEADSGVKVGRAVVFGYRFGQTRN